MAALRERYASALSTRVAAPHARRLFSALLSGVAPAIPCGLAALPDCILVTSNKKPSEKKGTSSSSERASKAEGDDDGSVSEERSGMYAIELNRARVAMRAAAGGARERAAAAAAAAAAAQVCRLERRRRPDVSLCV